MGADDPPADHQPQHTQVEEVVRLQLSFGWPESPAELASRVEHVHITLNGAGAVPLCHTKTRWYVRRARDPAARKW